MDSADQSSLRQFIDENTKLSRRIELGMDLAKELQKKHQDRATYPDLMPGRLRMKEGSLTISGSVLHYPRYDSEADSSKDIEDDFRMACSTNIRDLIRLLCGLFTGNFDPELDSTVYLTPIPDFESEIEVLEKLLKSGLSDDPSQQPNIREVIADLSKFSEGVGDTNIQILIDSERITAVTPHGEEGRSVDLDGVLVRLLGPILRRLYALLSGLMSPRGLAIVIYSLILIAAALLNLNRGDNLRTANNQHPDAPSIQQPGQSPTTLELPTTVVPLDTTVHAQDAELASPPLVPDNPSCDGKVDATSTAFKHFEDIDAASVHAHNIGCAALYEIMVGSEGKFYPDRDLVRREAAIVLSKALEHAKVSRRVYDIHFTDLEDLNPDVVSAINKVVGLGIIPHTAESQFLPESRVTRADVALYLIALLETATDSHSRINVTVDQVEQHVYLQLSSELKVVDGHFNDRFVDTAQLSQLQRNAINALSELGIAYGAQGNNYEPASYVTRAEMASLINRTMYYTRPELSG